jgi:hypothetical protein
MFVHTFVISNIKANTIYFLKLYGLCHSL